MRTGIPCAFNEQNKKNRADITSALFYLFSLHPALEGKILTLCLRSERNSCVSRCGCSCRSLSGHWSATEGGCIWSYGGSGYGTGLNVTINTESTDAVEPTTLILASINIEGNGHNLAHLDIELLHAISTEHLEEKLTGILVHSLQYILTTNPFTTCSA